MINGGTASFPLCNNTGSAQTFVISVKYDAPARGSAAPNDPTTCQQTMRTSVSGIGQVDSGSVPLVRTGTSCGTASRIRPTFDCREPPEWPLLFFLSSGTIIPS